eukprot:5400040-Pyramimonas_sp.AAC.1
MTKSKRWAAGLTGGPQAVCGGSGVDDVRAHGPGAPAGGGQHAGGHQDRGDRQLAGHPPPADSDRARPPGAPGEKEIQE